MRFISPEVKEMLAKLNSKPTKKYNFYFAAANFFPSVMILVTL